MAEASKPILDGQVAFGRLVARPPIRSRRNWGQAPRASRVEIVRKTTLEASLIVRGIVLLGMVLFQLYPGRISERATPTAGNEIVQRLTVLDWLDDQAARSIGERATALCQ